MQKYISTAIIIAIAVVSFSAVNISGTWFENRDEIEDKIEHLSTSGNLTGNVTGNLTGSVTGGITTNYTFLTGSGTTGQVWYAGGIITNINLSI